MVDWVNLIFVWNWETVPDCTHFDESEKRMSRAKKKKKKRGGGVGVRWTHKKPQTAHMTVSINTTLPIQINHHKQHWQCPLLAPSVLKWYENCVRVCGQNELEVCTTMAYPHFSSFHTIHKYTPTCIIKPLRTANWWGLKVDTAAGSNQRTSSHFHSLLFDCTTRFKQRHRVMTTTVYFSFFLGRMLLVWPHLRLRQLVARWCRRA